MSSASTPVSTTASAPASSMRNVKREAASSFINYTREGRVRYRAGLLAYALIIPYIGATITVVALINPIGPTFVPAWLGGTLSVSENAFLTGSITAFLIWLLLPLIVSVNFASAAGVNWHNFAQLRAQCCRVQQTLDATCASCWSTGSAHDDAESLKCIACHNAQAYLDHIDKESKGLGLQWLMGYGYLHLWQTLHRAEEELITIQQRPTVIQGALKDRLRLQSSGIDNHDELIRYLNRALVDLDPKLVPLLTGQVQSENDAERSQGAPPATLDEPVARAMLQLVQKAIHDYRDGQWNSVLEARNRLLKTALMVEIGAFSLLGLTVTYITSSSVSQGNGLPPNVTNAIVGAMAFFLIGGVVGGLYSRLRLAIEADAALEDYGLTIARLFATPLFAGLAGVGGVLLTGVLANLAGDSQESSFAQLFAIDPAHIALAALFGLAPARFFDGLGQADKSLNRIRQTDVMTTHLQSSSKGA